MLKLLGAMLIIAACTALGIKSVTKNRKTLKAITTLSDTLSEIARSINFQLDPLPDVIHRLGREQFVDEDSFINLLSSQIDTAPEKPLSELWHNALQTFSQTHHLPQKAFSIMNDIGESIGKMDYETEIHRLTAGQKALDELHTKMNHETAKTEKMTKSLGLILGVFIVILLL